ncbi:Mitochondrial substrate/solute carrier [Penicillium malachiteum]|uniref:Mitochondrial substrate/solute carrier n=1 Tax=Penicillium malachiteum TaxID=1324776 RepID=A0AAD6HN27_9EURO|nr:Mitochondrial substrate/solute carrier [Penicillium malachiteum]
MAEYKLSYEAQLDAFHPSYRWESHDPSEDWKSKALRGPALPIFGNAVAGAVGSAVSNVVVYPLNVIVARLQTQQRNKNKTNHTKDDDSENDDNEEAQSSIFEIAHKIYLQEGLAGFYPGLAQDTCKSVLDSFLFFLAYTIVRQRRIIARVGPARAARNKNIVLPILDELAIGVVAGSFSKLFTTPLANIVTRKQTAASKDGGSSQSTREIAARIRKEKGIAGFWSGYSATLILALNPSITFFLNALLKRLLLPRSKRDKPSPAITFLLAALSKSAASSVTYPFSLAKTRLQTMGGSKGEQTSGTTLKSSSLLSALMPRIITTVIAIARAEDISALYSGLQGEVLKGFFSHGFTMLAKDAVYGSIVKSYYMFLILLRRYPSPEELVERAREQAEEYREIALEGARDLAEKVKEGAEDALDNHSGGMAVDMTSNVAAAMAAKHGVDASSGFKVSPVPDEINETAELVGDYVEDEAAEWKSFYHWFWDKDRGHKE